MRGGFKTKTRYVHVNNVLEGLTPFGLKIFKCHAHIVLLRFALNSKLADPAAVGLERKFKGFEILFKLVVS